MPRWMRDNLEKLAKKQRRSLSNQIVSNLEPTLEKEEKK